MITIADIVNNDAFQAMAMTERINNMPFVPGKLGAMSLFEEKGITTTSVFVESENATIAIIPNTPRGAPANQNKRARRNARSLTVPHFPLEGHVTAQQIQNVRDTGGNELMGAQTVIDGEMQDLTRKHDVTLEYGRIGAIKGVITDSDGSTVIYDLYDEFDVTQDVVDFTLGTTSTKIKPLLHGVKRTIEAALGAGTYRYIHAMCGKDWFDEFTTHPDVEKWYQNYLEGAAQMQGDNRNGFVFGKIVFEEYVGSVNGVDFVEDNECHFFPVGVPGLFKTIFSPGDFMDTVNTPGLPRYARTKPQDYNKGLDILTESNPLSYCTKPKVLVKGETSN